MYSSGAPFPPPLPPSDRVVVAGKRPQATPPSVKLEGPAGAFLLELITSNGYPFKDHWSYFVRSHHHHDTGVVIHATGDVANGFRFEIKRCFAVNEPGTQPGRRVSLQWIDGKHFDEQAMLNNWELKFDTVPVCAFEESLSRVEAPGKTLNTVDGEAVVGKKIVMKNCQSWAIESAEQLVADNMLSPEVAAYLRAIEQ
ncbi:hypothetical protein LEL_06273 [Akanthomyces lecanii RCEF 1005]|uniref:Uncharacterized protein n=1 Tax=Akanthomyces lecanii RCEF 1005 TaxID=1081108 RepID=A0A168GK77_CORDF|nr:hypothetical protein LEL_06273 [Akanthomyces lecanii RCEF 1005]